MPTAPKDASDPLLRLWSADYTSKGNGPLLKVLDRYGHVQSHRNAYPGMVTTHGLVVRASPDVVVTEGTHGTERLFMLNRDAMPTVQMR